MPWTTQHIDTAISLDLFPAEVSVEPQTLAPLPKTRVIITTSPSPTLYVFIDTPQGPDLATPPAPIDLSRVYGTPQTGYDVLAALDPQDPTKASIVRIRPTGGCGCGSRLKSLTPFTTMRHTTAPVLQGPLPIPFAVTPAPVPTPTP